MKSLGHNLEFMKEYDLTKYYFDDHHITITLRDKDGMVCGFARRYVDYDKKADKAAQSQGTFYPAKYANTSAKVPIFQREALLYNLDRARKESFRRGEVVEGYFDVLSGAQAGVSTMMCSCGTEFTEFQVMSAMTCGFTHLNRVGDSDDAGRASALEFLDTSSGREGLRSTVMFLPFGEEVPPHQRDPDGFFRWYGVDAYYNVPTYSAFDLKLDVECGVEGFDGFEVAKRMIPIILSETDRIERSRLIHALVQRTGTPDTDIRAEIAEREDRHVNKVVENLQKRLHGARDSQDRKALIVDSWRELEVVEGGTADLSAAECARALSDAFEDFETEFVGLRGYKTNWAQFDVDFDGFPKKQEVLAIAGAPNSGKSAFLTNLTVDLVLNNDDVSVVYHIMDDPRRMAYAKLMACLTGLPIRMVRRAATDVMPFDHLRPAYLAAKDWLMQAVTESRIVVKGQEMGCGTGVATRLIDDVTQRTGRGLVYLGDSLHNLDDEGAGDNERLKFANVSRWAQNISDTREITMCFTCELTKEAMKGPPRLWMTAETRAIAYAFKAVGMLYNELHIKRDEAETFWVDEAVDVATGNALGAVKRPVIQITWEKNKISEFKQSHYWQFWDHSARVEQMDLASLKRHQELAATSAFDVPNLAAMSNMQGVLPHAPQVMLGQ